MNMNPFTRLYKPIAAHCSIRLQQHQQSKSQRKEFFKQIDQKFRQLSLQKSLLLDRMHKAWLANNAVKLKELSKELQIIAEQEEYLAKLPLSGRESEEQIHTIILDAALLVESFKRSTELPAEGLHYLIGISVDQGRIATEIAEFDYQYREVTGAVGDHQSTHRLLHNTYKAGRVLVCQMHSHPGKGKNANTPSDTDQKNQAVWEKTTKLVQGIWSRDGYLRWFTHQLPYQVRIIGNALEQIEPTVWKIKEA